MLHLADLRLNPRRAKRAHQHIAPIALAEHLDANRPTLIQLTAYKHAINLQKLTAGHPNCHVKKSFHLNNQSNSNAALKSGVKVGEKTDSTTVKTIAESYLLASVNFYRTAIVFNS